MTHFSNPKARRITARFAVSLFVFLAFGVGAWAQTMPGTALENVASVTYQGLNGATSEALSNPVVLVTTLPEGPSTISFVRLNAQGNDDVTINGTTCASASGDVVLPDPAMLDGSVLPLGSKAEVDQGQNFASGEILFIQLEDSDQNIDGDAVDQVEVSLTFSSSGDEERIKLSETDTNSGVFLGYIPTSSDAVQVRDCVLQVQQSAEVRVEYTDPTNGADVSSTTALVDPVGVVFDSTTGQPIDGAQVTILNSDTGLPAQVFGDDGASIFPAQITSGGAASDSSGVIYAFGAGQFRFPLLAPGNYRLVVQPPAGYLSPSAVPFADLQSLPGAPFTLVPGSIGNAFVVNAGPVIRIDIPLDPSSSELFLQKTTPQIVAAPGDFVEYELGLENVNTTAPVIAARIDDMLPPGFRYVPGSTTIDGAVAADPLIDGTGRALTFVLGNIAATMSVKVNYVAEVTLSAKGKEAVNTAVASALGLVQSNQASAKVLLREDLFASHSILVGRVLQGSCDAADENTAAGLQNARVYLEDGRYAVTDEAGRYHFEGLEPGTHVVQLDDESVPDSVAVIPCQNNTRFAGTAWSQFVDLQPGALWRANFYVRASDAGGTANANESTSDGAVTLQLLGEYGNEASGQSRNSFVRHTLRLTGTGDAAVERLRAMVMLPDDYSYVSESAMLSGGDSVTPTIIDQSLAFNLGERDGQWQEEINFTIRSAALSAQADKPLTRAMLMFKSASGEKIRTQPAQIALDKSAEKTAGPGSNTRGDSKAAAADNTDTVRVKFAADTSDDKANEVDDGVQPDLYADTSWVSRLQPGRDLLLPAKGFNPAVPSLKVAVKHATNERVTVLLNEAPISGLHFDGVTRNKAKTVAISRWRGADLQPGTNKLLVVISDKQGNELTRITRDVHFSGGPVRAKLNHAESVLLADGRTQPALVFDLVDRDEHPARPDSIGVYAVESPYRSQWEVDAARENQLVVVGDRDPVYSVNDKGQAVILLEPTSQSGEVVVNFRYENNLKQELRAWLKPAARDWILVGLAEGTAGFNTISDNLENAQDDGVDEDLYTDGRVAFFAKGRIRGDYLLTLAYDSKGDGEEDENRLLGGIDPDRFYTLYGDATEQRFDAASQDKLYLKIERGQFYAMFGDHQTGMTVTELSRYNRTLQGFKSEFRGKRAAYTAFAAKTEQAFIKDELRGDGTSGRYFLSRRPLVINSEKVSIEVRDKLRTEVILETRNLARHLDYNIDYLNGTLIFKQPVAAQDQNFNPVFIVIDYESRDQQDAELTAGGRGALILAEGRGEVGISAITEGTNGGDGELFGLDARFDLRPGTELRAEYASSSSVRNGQPLKGSAYLLELRHQGSRLESTVYAREQEGGFGLGQQRGTESATRKTGFDGRLKMSPQLTLNSEVYRQQALQTGGMRDVAKAEVLYQSAKGTVGIGLLHARDEDQDGNEAESQQVYVNASTQLLDNRLTVRATNEFSIGGKNAIQDLPRRTLLGMDYRLNDRYSLYAEHEIGQSDVGDGNNTRAGIRMQPWERADIDASINQQTTEYGPRVFANVGLVQGLQLNERWTLDAGLDLGSALRQPGLANLGPPSSTASTSALNEDYSSVFLGALYRAENWSATSRWEFRDSDQETRHSLLFGMYREEQEGKGFTLSGQLFDSQLTNGATLRNADSRLGWSYRPSDSNWIVFDRLDVVHDDISSTSRNSSTWKIVNNFNANWKINHDSLLALQYGAKYVRADVANSSQSGFSDLIGAGYRRDLNSRWDLGAHTNLRHSWRSGVFDYSIGLELGYSFAKNLWLSAGYNFVGFEDNDFTSAAYLAQGPYLKFRIKADQHSLDDLRRGMLFRRQNESALTSRRKPQLESSAP